MNEYCPSEFVIVESDDAPESITVTSASAIPSTLTRPLIPAVRSSVPSNGTFSVRPRATVTLCDVVANS